MITRKTAIHFFNGAMAIPVHMPVPVPLRLDFTATLHCFRVHTAHRARHAPHATDVSHTHRLLAVQSNLHDHSYCSKQYDMRR